MTPAENVPPTDTNCHPGRGRSAPIAAAALALGATVEQAAAEAGVSVRSVYRWMKRPKFRALVGRTRSQAVSEAVGMLAKNMSAASSALVALLKSRDANCRLRAARAVLELAAKLRDAEEMERRVTELEERFARLSTGEREAT